MAIGRSTDPSTKDNRTDVHGDQPASFRYNNPGAQYPSAEAAKFGQTGYGVIGDGKYMIAAFPSPVNGAASNFDLMYRKYTGMTIGAAGKKWTGDNSFGIPGYDSNKVLTKQMLDDEPQAVEIMKAVAGRESGKGTSLTESDWHKAYRMFKLGSADAFLASPDATPPVPSDPAAPNTGTAMVQLALTRVGEKYVNVQVPKDDANWHGPWDCAEFASWVTFQVAKKLYGCLDDQAPPGQADAYTGAWKSDSERLGERVSVERAAATPGAFLLRYPPAAGGMGHIAISDGHGGTIEAKGARYGVVVDKAEGRSWDTGVLIPGVSYGAGPPVDVRPPDVLYKQGAPNMDPAVVAAIQDALLSQGYDVGSDGADGDFGDNTTRGVVAFQEANGLVVDGEVGKETAGALGVDLKTGKRTGVPGAVPGPGTGPFWPPVVVPPPGPQPKPQPEQSGIDAIELLGLLPRALRILGTFKQIPGSRWTLPWLLIAVEAGVTAMAQGEDSRQLAAEPEIFPPDEPSGRPINNKETNNMSDPTQLPGLPSSGSSEQIQSTIRTILKFGGGVLVALGVVKSPDWASVVTHIEPWIGIIATVVGWWWSNRATSPAGLISRAATTGLLARPIVVTETAKINDSRVAQLVATPNIPVESESAVRPSSRR